MRGAYIKLETRLFFCSSWFSSISDTPQRIEGFADKLKYPPICAYALLKDLKYVVWHPVYFSLFVEGIPPLAPIVILYTEPLETSVCAVLKLYTRKERMASLGKLVCVHPPRLRRNFSKTYLLLRNIQAKQLGHQWGHGTSKLLLLAARGMGKAVAVTGSTIRLLYCIWSINSLM